MSRETVVPGLHLDEALHHKIVGVLIGSTCLLILLSLIGTYIRFGLGHDFVLGWIPLFNLDAEANVPTWFSSLLLLISGVLAGLITIVKVQRTDAFRREWIALSLLFLSMSLDETGQVHETVMATIRHWRPMHGVLHNAWVIPGLIFILAFGAATLRFWFNLPRRFQILFAVSALVYFGGAIGVEMLDGAYSDSHGENNLTYALLTTVEESLEMFGSVLFVSTFFKYIHALGLDVLVQQVAPDRTAAASEPASLGSPLIEPEPRSDLRLTR